MQRIIKVIISLFLLVLATSAFANITVPMYLVAKIGPGKYIGSVTFSSTPYGLLATPDLFNLPPGIHGFHIHINPDCADNGMAAGGHLDPQKTGKHLGPYNAKGHLGDLPVLIVDSDGKATLPVLAPRLTLTAIENHSLMIHQGGDNYSDKPKSMGGGGERIACGVIK